MNETNYTTEEIRAMFKQHDALLTPFVKTLLIELAIILTVLAGATWVVVWMGERL